MKITPLSIGLLRYFSLLSILLFNFSGSSEAQAAGSPLVVQSASQNPQLSLALLKAPSSLAMSNASLPPNGAVLLSAANTHTCSLTANGAVKCWGDNTWGMLGDGEAFAQNNTPVVVTGLGSHMQSVAAGSVFTCALTSTGGVKCWGHNASGELGDGSTIDRPTPVDVSGLTGGVLAITAGVGYGGLNLPLSDTHACALLTGGAVKCWGSNTSGQLGDGSITNRLIPVSVIGLSGGVLQVSAGAVHTCALLTGGAVKCWGDNSSGQLGDGNLSQQNTPIAVSGLSSGVIAIAAGGSHTCALLGGGAVKCWGDNSSNQLGDGGALSSPTPVVVSGMTSGVAAISAGGENTCARLAAGALTCWGGNHSGQLGDGSLTPSPVAEKLANLPPVATVSVGYEYICASDANGQVYCWGANQSGQLGDGAPVGQFRAVTVGGLPAGVIAISAGDMHTCALTTAGGIKCWGRNDHGQLGNGTTTDSAAPVDVIGLTSGVKAIAAKGSVSCAITVAGGAKCWGANASGSLGDGTTTDRLIPVDVSGLTSGVKAITVSCAVLLSGAAKCWGNNNGGRLGDGTTTNRLAPVNVSGLTSGVSEITLGQSHGCALMGSGGIKCWGANSNGALGDGTLVSHLTPVDVTGLPGGAVKVVTSITSTCALTTSSGIKCWGNNSFGQLGDGLGGDTGYGSELYSATPVDVVGLTSGQSDLAMSYVYGCGSSASGGVQCWGINDAGQAGTGFANLVFLYPKPTAVLGLGNNIAAVSVGEDHACALVTGGVVRCWGSNGYGELGSTGRAYQITAGAVQNLPGSVSQVAAGENYSCLLSNAGGVACWGDNEYGQLGNGSLRQSLTPVTVSGLTSGIKAISTSRQSMTPFSCALTVGGGVKCWGDNSYGQLGDGTTNPHLSPVDVNGLASGVIQVSVGMNHACALTAAGGVKCWGDNSSFQLGDGTQAPRFTPVDASGLANGVHQISAGSGYSCALLNSGGVKCWGIPGPHTPGDIPGVSNLSSGITAIAVESSGSLNCAITVGGGVQCWNYDSLSSNWSSYSIGLDSGVTQIDTGNGDVCATTSSGTAFCYGTNLNGQLGNGSYINGGPYPISGLGSDIAMVATGGSHTCALTKGGTISCWGDNSYGQLGYGSATNYAASPRPAVSFGPTLYLPLIVR